jgi:predicted small metal-binding protein
MGSDDPPSFHAANCKRDGCDFSTLRSSMVQIYGDLEDHLKDEHGVDDEEWRDIREGLA